jgi:hypothetical protein
MYVFQEIKKWVGQIIEIGVLLIALGVVVEILFGRAVPFVGTIATNLMGLIHGFGENGFAGLIAAGIILFMFYRLYAKVELPVTNSGKRQAPPARKSTRGRRK